LPTKLHPPLLSDAAPNRGKEKGRTQRGGKGVEDGPFIFVARLRRKGGGGGKTLARKGKKCPGGKKKKPPGISSPSAERRGRGGGGFQLLSLRRLARERQKKREKVEKRRGGGKKRRPNLPCATQREKGERKWKGEGGAAFHKLRKKKKEGRKLQ